MQINFIKDREFFRVWLGSWAGDGFEIVSELRMQELHDSAEVINKTIPGAIEMVEHYD